MSHPQQRRTARESALGSGALRRAGGASPSPTGLGNNECTAEKAKQGLWRMVSTRDPQT